LDDQQIILIANGVFESDFLDQLAKDVSLVYHYPTIIQETDLDLALYFDAGRRQYNANQLLELVDNMPFRSAIKKVGLFRVDLFIPILTYIFGQAHYKGNTGIASLYRLKNEQYGLKSDEDLLYERFRKVIIHELGHTFGLVHCHIPNCVMRSSTYVEDIDQKRHFLCTNCQEELKETLRSINFPS